MAILSEVMVMSDFFSAGCIPVGDSNGKMALSAGMPERNEKILVWF